MERNFAIGNDPPTNVCSLSYLTDCIFSFPGLSNSVTEIYLSNIISPRTKTFKSDKFCIAVNDSCLNLSKSLKFFKIF